MTALINLPRAAWKRQPQGPVVVNYNNYFFNSIRHFIIPVWNGLLTNKSPNTNTTSRIVNQLGQLIQLNGASGYIEFNYGTITNSNWSMLATGMLSAYQNSAIATLALDAGSGIRDRSLYYNTTLGFLAYIYDGAESYISASTASADDAMRYCAVSGRSTTSSLAATKNREKNTIVVNNSGSIYSAKLVVGYGGGDNAYGGSALNSSYLLKSFFMHDRYLSDDEVYQFSDPWFVYTLLKLSLIHI